MDYKISMQKSEKYMCCQNIVNPLINTLKETFFKQVHVFCNHTV